MSEPSSPVRDPLVMTTSEARSERTMSACAKNQAEA